MHPFDRRSFLQATFAGSLSQIVPAASGALPTTIASKSVRTSTLEVGYLEAGPADGSPVLLLHGFPDAATAWVAVMEHLASRGRRAIAPFIRGCGPTRFLDAATPRAGDFAALGQDALDIVDALDLRDLDVVGQDWGSPTAEMVAMFRPERVRRLVKLNWYGVYSMAEMARAQGFAYPQLRSLWYVWMLNTPLGKMVLDYDRVGFAKTLWAEWSPSWNPQARQSALDGVAKSFEGADWARVALSAYRADISPDAERDPRHDALRAKLKEPPAVKVPVAIVTGADDGVEKSPLSREAMARVFPAGVTVEALPGAGHFPQREAPEQIASVILAA